MTIVRSTYSREGQFNFPLIINLKGNYFKSGKWKVEFFKVEIGKWYFESGKWKVELLFYQNYDRIQKLSVLVCMIANCSNIPLYNELKGNVGKKSGFMRFLQYSQLKIKREY